MSSVDVFVPCYNYGRYLAGCIDSILSQESVQVRVLIIDDASTDGSVAEAYRLAADPRVTVLAHVENKGHIHTYNEGIAWASAEYMILVSADDLLAPMALARAVALMQANPGVGFVTGRVLEFNDDAALAEMTAAARANIAGPATIRSGIEFIRTICAHPQNPISASTVVVRTELQQQLGGYLPELPHAGDLEMWLRLAAHADLGMADAVLGFTRIHARNMRHRYFADHMIEDFKQRRLAFETLFIRHANVLRNAPALARLARRSLAEEAIWASMRCFDKGDDDATSRLANLAREIDGTIVRSPLWWKTITKRAMGRTAWRTVEPMLERLRSVLPEITSQYSLRRDL